MKNTLLNDLKPRLLTNPDQLVGRTIQAVERDWCDGLYLLLDNGQVAIINAERGYEDSVELNFKDSVNQWDDLDNLVEIGVVTAEQHAQWKAEEAEENKRNVEARERAEFEKLRRKFQPEAIPTPKTNQLGWPEE